MRLYRMHYSPDGLIGKNPCRNATQLLKDVRNPLSKYQTKSQRKEAMIKSINVYLGVFKYLSELFETLSTPGRAFMK